METTRSRMPHVVKGRTESRANSAIIDYVAHPKKTDSGRLITGCEVSKRGKWYRRKLSSWEKLPAWTAWKMDMD